MQKNPVRYINVQIISLAVIFILPCCTGCKKLIEVKAPTDQIISSVVFTNDATATAAVTGIYSQMMNTGGQFSAAYTTLYAGMAADELLYYSSGTNDEFIINEITLANHGLLTTAFWQPAYRYIYAANLVLEQLNASTQLSPAIKSQLSGEAMFIRAFCYFNLINLFGDVPLVSSSNYTRNAALSRSPVTEIYALMTQDLTAAAQLLPSVYTGTGKLRPNKWAATALLARTALYTRQWQNAETAASAVINANQYKLENNPDSVFLSGSAEAIWQLQPVNPAINTWEGNIILPSSVNSRPTFIVRKSLLDSFDTGDKRKTSWITSRTYSGQTIYYPSKYKKYNNSNGVTEYYAVLRLAEQYLIRAEARIQQGRVSEGMADINILRQRAAVAPLTAITKAEALSMISHERQIELFAEWGHRWMDLKRTNTADVILKTLKPATWQTTDQLWPIPIDQLKSNPALTQNAGY